MNTTLIFREKAVQKGEEYFRSIHIVPEQRQIVAAIAELISKFTGLRVIALKGFILMVFRDWQLDNNLEISILATSTPQRRVEVVTNLFERLNIKLSKLLKSETDKDNLTKAIYSGLDYYRSEEHTSELQSH